MYVSKASDLSKYSPTFFIKCCPVGEQLFCHGNVRFTFLVISLDSEYAAFLQGENIGFKFPKWHRLCYWQIQEPDTSTFACLMSYRWASIKINVSQNLNDINSIPQSMSENHRIF